MKVVFSGTLLQASRKANSSHLESLRPKSKGPLRLLCPKAKNRCSEHQELQPNSADPADRI